MDPATITALITTLGPMIAAKLGSQGPAPGQQRDENTINEILKSISGDGKYSNLFEADYDAFQKSFVDPAMQQFRDVTAPGIQQEFIASGQQRGTGLDDTLSRAGVSMQDMLNKQYAGFQESALNRQMNALQGTLGQGQQQNTQGGFGQAAAGTLASPAFPAGMEALLKKFQAALSGSSGNPQLTRNQFNPGTPNTAGGNTGGFAR